MSTHIDDSRLRNNSKVPIYRICLTGGPCAGKTSALTYLTDKLSKLGFRVFSVLETPTMTV